MLSVMRDRGLFLLTANVFQQNAAPSYADPGIAAMRVSRISDYALWDRPVVFALLRCAFLKRYTAELREDVLWEIHSILFWRFSPIVCRQSQVVQKDDTDENSGRPSRSVLWERGGNIPCAPR